MRRCPRKQVLGGPHRLSRRRMEDSQSAGAVSFGCGGPKRVNCDYASGEKASKADRKESRMGRGLLVQHHRTRKRTVAELGEREERRRQRKRQRQGQELRQGQQWEEGGQQQPLEGQQGRPAQEGLGPAPAAELGNTVLPAEAQPIGLDWLKQVLHHCTSLTDVGGAMLWLMFNRPRLQAEGCPALR